VKTWSDYVAEAEQYKHYKQRCEQLEAELTEICRICGWYATEHAGPDLEVHHALKVELLDIAERALASGGDQR
jgi:hypothetical protein